MVGALMDADPKKPKPLTPRERAKNVFDALAEDALTDDAPLTERERVQAGRVREKLKKSLEENESKGEQERAKKKGSPGSGYVM